MQPQARLTCGLNRWLCRDKVMLGADVGADAARKDDDFQQEGVKGVAAEKEKHWRDGGEF